MDPDPGGPKTRGSGGSGSGSATLLTTRYLVPGVVDLHLHRAVPDLSITESCIRI
jgi:hypothetical protein